MIRDVHPVMGHLVEVDRADQVARADQGLLDVPGQVAAIEEVELAEPEADRQAAGVVRGIDRQVGGRLRAERDSAAADVGAGNDLAPGAEDHAASGPRGTGAGRPP